MAEGGLLRQEGVCNRTVQIPNQDVGQPNKGVVDFLVSSQVIDLCN